MSAYSIATRGLAGRKIPQGVLAPMNALLFGSGEQGAWYDPSDLSTLFQDAAGTTPVTAMEQFVGLMLDKSKGLVLGDELVTGGGFDDPANWTSSTWTVSAGVATYPDTINDFIRPANANLLPLVAGKFYRVRFTLSGVTGSAVCAVANADGSVAYTALTTFTTDGEKQFIIYAATSTTNIRFYGYTNSGGTWNLNDLSIKELPGNHASQATTTKRGVVSRLVNLQYRTEQFSNAYWAKTTGASVSPGAITSPTGGLADTLAYDGSGATGSYRLYGGGLLHPAGVSLTQYIMLRSVSGATTVRIGGNTSGGGFLVCNLTTEWQKFQISGVSNGSSVVQLLIYSVVGNNDPFTIGVWGASCTYTADAHLPYQWVNTATDYDDDPNKFPTYIRFDGVDDAYQTNSIDFTGTDKMTVIAGISSQENDATFSSRGLLGIGTFNTNGSLTIVAPYANSKNSTYAFTRGTTNYLYSALTPPTGLTNAVIAVTADNQQPDIKIRAKGFETTFVNNSTGPGNYGNVPVNIGIAPGNGQFFYGRLYSLIVRGAQTPLSQIEAGELHIKQKMKLP